MNRKSHLLATLFCASLASLALAFPRAAATPESVDDPIACPYCGGSATLETLTADLGIRFLTRAGQFFFGY